MTPAEPWQWALVFAGFASIYLLIGLGKGWLMRAVQMTIFLVVMGSNIIWNWTPNTYIPGLVGLGLAWLITVLPLALWLRYEEWKARRHPSNEHSEDIAPYVVRGDKDPEGVKAELRKMVGMDKPWR